MIRTEILPHLSVAKRGYASKKVTWRKLFQCFLCLLKASFQWHIMRRKQKGTSLCSLCSYVKMNVFMSKDEKINVFVKPNEQCRACSNIVAARKRTFRGTRKERLTRSLIRSSTSQLVNFSTRQLLNSLTSPLVNSLTSSLVNFPTR